MRSRQRGIVDGADVRDDPRVRRGPPFRMLGVKHVKGAVLRSGETTAASAAGLPTAGLAQRGKWVPKPCAARHAAKPHSIARL